MSAQPVVVGLSVSADSYIRHGWKLCAIPAGTKGPATAGWNKIENALTEAPPAGAGVGLLHAYSGTAALDIDDYELAKQWLVDRGIDLDELFNAPGAVGIDSGNPGHSKLLFNVPFVLPTKKIVVGDRTALEFRCGTVTGLSAQDVLPPSRHPSGTTYRWVGMGNWQNLPPIPENLMAAWTVLLAEDSQRKVKTETATLTSFEELKSALFALPADCPRKQWVEVGMALAAAQTDATTDQLFDLWDEWSQGAPNKYPGLREMRAQWKSFRNRPDGIGVGTLFCHAGLTGWRRPPPSIHELFFPVMDNAEEVQHVVQNLSAMSKLPENDLSLWPSILVRRANELSVEVGCDPAVPLMAGLLAVSAAADKQSQLSINPSWRVSPTFWGMTIGDPSAKKTPGSKSMFAPLRKLEAEDRTRYDAEMIQWIGKEARHAGELKAFREWQQSPEAMMPNAVPPDLMLLPPQPQPLRLVLTDATTQKVVAMAEHRPRGFLLYLDEMNRWLTKLGDSRHSDDRGCWIQGYETGAYSMDRMGSGSTRVEHMALSMYGNCQPAVFRANMQSASQDGIIQRFMPVVLNPFYNKLWQQAVPAFMSSENDYEQLIRRVYATPAFEYTLSAGANDIFRAFCQWILDLRETHRVMGDSDIYQTAMGKAEGNCARLLLLFHMIDHPYDLQVSEETTLRAVQLFKTFFIPSLRYAFLEVGQQRDPVAEIVFNLVLQWSSSRPSITMGELRKEVKLRSEKKDYPPQQLDLLIRATMDELASINHVAILQDHPRYPSWTINPAMAEQFANDRRKIIVAKQRNIELLRHHVRTGRGTEATVGNTMGYTPDMELPEP